MGQSSNDVFPSAVHLAALDQLKNDLLPALDRLAAGARGEGERVRRRRQVGPHAPDGCRPGHARPGVRRLRGAGATGHRASRSHARARGPDPARRDRGRHRPQHASRVRRARAPASRRRDRSCRPPPGRSVRVAGCARRARRGLRRAEDGRRVADEDRERSASDGLGPPRGPRRDRPPRAPEGQLDHARQGQSGHPRGRDPGRRAGDRQRRRGHRRRACRGTSS